MRPATWGGLLGGLGALFAAAAVAILIGARGAGAPVLPPPSPAAATDGPHLPFGPVRPARLLPDVPVTRDDGVATTLAKLASGRFTLLQLMFSGCSTTCPIQGAIFQRVQAELAERGETAGLLSVSVDAVGDTPSTIRAWLDGFQAGADWRAAVPAPDSLGPLLDVLHGRGAGVDVHDARVYLIDPDGRLLFATEDMPDPQSLIRLLHDAAAAPTSAN